MQRTTIAAILLSFAFAGGAAAQQAVPTNPVTGAAQGAAAGAAQGAAVAGPVGAIVGAPLGLAAGAVAGTVGAVGTVAGAVTGTAPAAAPGGPLVVNVRPAPTAPVGRVVTYGGVTYDRVPARALFTTGPRYTERSGVRIGRGSVIPAGIDVAPMRNVSIRRLRPGAAYGYFVSPDNKVVVVEPTTRRVARVISRSG